jgi:aryl-alcohol dehydrogenase-like predicted oxidoreductase
MSEEILGKAIKEYALPRDEIVVMTKVSGYVKPKGSDGTRRTNQSGLSRKVSFFTPRSPHQLTQHSVHLRLRPRLQASLARLQLDYIDLLQCHSFDYNTPIEETVGCYQL